MGNTLVAMGLSFTLVNGMEWGRGIVPYLDVLEMVLVAGYRTVLLVLSRTVSVFSRTSERGSEWS